MEMVDIVDETGKILYQTTKEDAHTRGLLHKTVIAEVINGKGEWLLVCPKSHKQDAGQYVSPVGGHVTAGETDEEALKREVLEEVGIQDFRYTLKGRAIFNRFILSRHENHFFIVYEIFSDADPTLGDEGERYRRFTPAKLSWELRSQPRRFGDAFHFLVGALYGDLFSHVDN